MRFARWITPEGLPVRHDTDFFAVALPGDQSPTLIGTEADIGEWCQPTDALADAATGRIGLLPPTWAALQTSGWSRRRQRHPVGSAGAQHRAPGPDAAAASGGGRQDVALGAQ